MPQQWEYTPPSKESRLRESDIGLDVEGLASPIEGELREKYGDQLLARVAGLEEAYRGMVDQAGSFSMKTMEGRASEQGREARQAQNIQYTTDFLGKKGQHEEELYRKKEKEAEAIATLQGLLTAATTAFDKYEPKDKAKAEVDLIPKLREPFSSRLEPGPYSGAFGDFNLREPDTSILGEYNLKEPVFGAGEESLTLDPNLLNSLPEGLRDQLQQVVSDVNIARNEFLGYEKSIFDIANASGNTAENEFKLSEMNLELVKPNILNNDGTFADPLTRPSEISKSTPVSSKYGPYNIYPGFNSETGQPTGVVVSPALVEHTDELSQTALDQNISITLVTPFENVEQQFNHFNDEFNQGGANASQSTGINIKGAGDNYKDSAISIFMETEGRRLGWVRTRDNFNPEETGHFIYVGPEQALRWPETASLDNIDIDPEFTKVLNGFENPGDEIPV